MDISLSKSGSSSTRSTSLEKVIECSLRIGGRSPGGRGRRPAIAPEQAALDRLQGIEFLLEPLGFLLFLAQAALMLGQYGVQQCGYLARRRRARALANHLLQQ